MEIPVRWLSLLLSTMILLFGGCGGGSASAQPPAGLAYLTGTAVYTVGTTISANRPTSIGGTVTAYSVSPDLPAGLSLDDHTGIISGTPTGEAATSRYKVTASNASGRATATLTITVDGGVAGIQFMPNMNQYITPTAVQGSTFQQLITPWLVNGNPWAAGHAVSSVVSTDGKTLFVLTSGFNRIYYADSAQGYAFGPEPPVVEFAPGMSRSSPSTTSWPPPKSAMTAGRGPPRRAPRTSSNTSTTPQSRYRRTGALPHRAGNRGHAAGETHRRGMNLGRRLTL
jgi:hypothetical protein